MGNAFSDGVRSNIASQYQDTYDKAAQIGGLGGSSLPVYGDARDALETVQGQDLQTGEALPLWQRGLTGAAMLMPFVGWAVVRKVVDGGGDFLKSAAKHGDEAVDALKHADEASDAAKDASKKADILAQNRAQGRAYEQKSFVEFNQSFTHSQEQITVKTQGSVKTRIDAIGFDADGKIVIHEFKSSATAPLTENQKYAFPEIIDSGATVQGKGKGIFAGGYNIPAGTDVKVVRPTK